MNPATRKTSRFTMAAVVVSVALLTGAGCESGGGGGQPASPAAIDVPAGHHHHRHKLKREHRHKLARTHDARVQPHVQVAVQRSSIRIGSAMRFDGRVSSARRGRIVLLQARGWAGWRTVSRRRLDAHHAFRFSVHAHKRGWVTFRVLLRGQHSVASPRVRIHVRRLPPEPVHVARTHAPRPKQSSCTPGYRPCVPVAYDVDCAGGSGDGPAYVQGPIHVTGSDPYELDYDHDGVACEAS